MSSNIANGYIDLNGTTATIINEINLPETTLIENIGNIKHKIDTMVPIYNPVFHESVSFENLQIDNVPISNVLLTTSSITFQNAVIVEDDIYTIQLSFSNSITLPYNANIVVNELDGVAMTVVITEYNTNYLRFRIMKPTFEYIVIKFVKHLLNINCAILKGSTVIHCANVVFLEDVGSLDVISDHVNEVAVYALRRLYASYSGPQLRVARSDNTAIQVDVYYDKNGSVTSPTSLSLFAGTAQLYVIKWYDQSGKNNHGTGVQNPILDYTTNSTKHSINLEPDRYFTITSTNDIIINASITPFWTYASFRGNGIAFPNSIISRDSGGSGTTDYRIWFNPTENQWYWGTGAAANLEAWMKTGISGGTRTDCVISASYLPISNTKGFYVKDSSGINSSAFRNTTGKYTGAASSVDLIIGKYGFIGRIYEVLIYRTDMSGIHHEYLMDNLTNKFL
jgi:hypothetical protein